MKLHLTQSNGNNLITSYGSAWVEINKQRYTSHLLVLPTELIPHWLSSSSANNDFANLSADNFIAIAALKPEVVLLGTGDKHQFLHPSIYQALTEKGIPLECMTTAAACRTYNILMSEGRNVLAALILA